MSSRNISRDSEVSKIYRHKENYGINSCDSDKVNDIKEHFKIALKQNEICSWYIDISSKTIKVFSCCHCLQFNDISYNDISDLKSFALDTLKIYKDDISRYMDSLNNVINKGINETIRIRKWSEKSRNYIWMENNFAISNSEDNSPKHIIATLRDITAEKIMERQFKDVIEFKNSNENNCISYVFQNLGAGTIEDFYPKNKVNFKLLRENTNLFDYLKGMFCDITLQDNELEVFSLESLRKSYQNATCFISKAFWGTMRESGKRMWIEINCSIIEHSDTKEIIAFMFIKDNTRRRLLEGLMRYLSKNSYERSGAIFLENRKLQAITEERASYSDWKVGDYDKGIKAYCKKNVPVEHYKKIVQQMLLDTVVKELADKDTYSVQYDIIGEDGELHRKETRFSFIDRENGVILIFRLDVALYEKLRYSYNHDSLTGLFKRSKVFLETRKMIDLYKDVKFAFVQLDIDRFKLYNSSFGEQEGNNLLLYVANIIQDAVSDVSLCTYGRINADIFCFCIPYDEKIIKDKIDILNMHLSEYRCDYLLRFKVGICIVEDNAMSLEEISAKAAIIAQSCKKNVNHSYVIYDTKEESKQQEENDIINDMNLALNNNQFVVYLQPKIRIKDEKACGAEALVRWLHPKKGIISPGVFIPIFEKNGFIANVDYYIWEKVCIMIRQWIDEGYNPYPISVNVSRISLYNPNLTNKLIELINKYNLSSDLLQLEITESAYMTNPEMMLNIIDSLHDAGFMILMDDFGSGYSSLNTLKDFPIDILKFDMEFISNKNLKGRSKIILSAMIKMAKELDMKVIMEGVETKEQRDFLECAGCDYIQGYYYERPIPVDKYVEKYIK